ncbi:MAG: hypothetical protein HYV07_18965 [Deltaproteobacteria bacterium]|nr:hypothetical protein [Deltaproteobacteria bacterium]
MTFRGLVKVGPFVVAACLAIGCGERARRSSTGNVLTGSGRISFGVDSGVVHQPPATDSGVPDTRVIDQPNPADASACAGAGCPTSGIEGSKPLASLNAAEIRQLCEWSTSIQGGPGQRQCPGAEGTTITVPTVDECAAASSFAGAPTECTVSMTETCMTAIEGDTCNFFSEEACAQYFQCLGGS